MGLCLRVADPPRIRVKECVVPFGHRPLLRPELNGRSPCTLRLTPQAARRRPANLPLACDERFGERNSSSRRLSSACHDTMLHVRQGYGHYGLRGRCELLTRELFNSARRRSRSHWRPGGAAVGQTYQASALQQDCRLWPCPAFGPALPSLALPCSFALASLRWLRLEESARN